MVSPLHRVKLLTSIFFLRVALCVPLCNTALLTARNDNGTRAAEVDLERSSLTRGSCSCCGNGCPVDSKGLENSIQSSYPEENDNRVWMLTTEGIQSDLIQYNRIIPGHKYIINNVGGRRLRFGPEDPPGQYVTILGEYDCVGPLAPLGTLFPNAAKDRTWWTHQTRPHEKWIFNAPVLEESSDSTRGFCITVTDIETGKTAEVKLRVGALTQP